MSKRKINEAINQTVVFVIDSLDEIKLWCYPAKKLRHCAARVFDVGDKYILQSYDTIVACIDKSSGILYDGLRYVYGYTATSAQHISKFGNDYGATSVKRYQV